MEPPNQIYHQLSQTQSCFDPNAVYHFKSKLESSETFVRNGRHGISQKKKTIIQS